ncbi:MAG: dihydrolipoyllysine-residue succinyltransferase [Desulfuromonas sp.]|nr:MAG: dihydrolipoyllysine-residue succinyltransferase [Desulfuromonas sp.]
MDIKVPEVGESIQEALVASWLKKDGEQVAKDDTLCELETDKINVEVPAEVDGVLRIKVPEGETVQIGTVIATIDEGPGATPKDSDKDAEQKPNKHTEKKADSKTVTKAETGDTRINPAAKQLAREKGLDPSTIQGSGRKGRVTFEDVRQAAAGTVTDKEAVARPEAPDETLDTSGRPTTREAMTPIRQRIAARLLEARQQTAMLTTFNEADMSEVIALRSKHQQHFTKKHGVKLGLMSFFVKATVEALREYPTVNARIDGQEIVYHHYYDIGIAVGTERGLVVPVLRDAGELTFGEIEQQIAHLAEKAVQRKLTLAELEGGTFTISNGGVYGSLLSTPILNPPQTGVLGMHAITERPVVRDGEIVIRPIMNLAMSYDHRLIDGREAVGFLRRIKEFIEDPEGLLLEL